MTIILAQYASSREVYIAFPFKQLDYYGNIYHKLEKEGHIAIKLNPNNPKYRNNKPKRIYPDISFSVVDEFVYYLN